METVDTAPDSGGVDDTDADHPPRPPVRATDSLHARFALLQALLVVAVVGTTLTVIFTVERQLLVDQGKAISEELGNRMVGELEKRISMTESLTTALANLGESLEPDVEAYSRTVPRLLDYEGYEHFIAGGGIWPEPGAFTPGVERRSFFWGRNPSGELEYYDDYNREGYHREEWYVPAATYPDGRVFWSISYMDPYSYQPMVTCTVPMRRDGEFIGVATVDLKLEGLDAFFDEVSDVTGGYVFAVDRNNKFISFPDPEQVKVYGTDAEGHTTEDFRDTGWLAETEPAYGAVNDALASIDEDRIARARTSGRFTDALVEALDAGSDQITAEDAIRTAAVLADPAAFPPGETRELRFVEMDTDPILGEAAIASIFNVPSTAWKIVSVTPRSHFYGPADLTTRKVAIIVVALEVGALLVTFMVLRRIIIRPVRSMSNQIRQISASNDPYRRLDDSAKDELGRLAYEFNRRSDQLVSASEEIENAKRELELRIVERQQVEEERLAHLKYLEDMRVVDDAIHRATDLDHLMDDAVRAMLELFDCDRCWLLHPCDPHASEWRVRIERTSDAFPGLAAQDGVLRPDQMDDEALEFMQKALDTTEPVAFDAAHASPMPHISKEFAVRAQLAVAVRPRTGRPWLLGLHHCRGPRTWNSYERRLLRDLAARITDALSTWILFETIQASEDRFQAVARATRDAIYDHDLTSGLCWRNDRAVELFGGTASVDDYGRWWRDHIHPEDREAAVGRLEHAIGSGAEHLDEEYRFRGADGHYVDVRDRGLIVRDGRGRAVRVIGAQMATR